MRRVISLYLPTWATDRLRRNRRSGKADGLRPGRPFATAIQDGPRRLIVAADELARQAGVEAGLPLAQARALAPDLMVVEADPTADEAALRRLLAWCVWHYSPCVGLDGPDSLWIDVTGCAHLFGGEAAMLEDLHTRLRRSAVSACAAMADTATVAWAVARFATTLEMPLQVVPPGAAPTTLADLPPAALRLDIEAVGSLRRLGIRRIGQLLELPRGPLALRFGSEIARRLDQALGRVAEPMAPILPPGTPHQRMAFPEPIGRPDDLHEGVERLGILLCRNLEAVGLGLRRCDLLIYRVDGQVQALRVGTARATRDPAHLARLFAERIETIDPGFGIEAMVLAAPLTERLSPAQLCAQLDVEEAEPDLSQLVDRLSNRLGVDRLYRLAPVESDLPERSVRRVAPLAPPTRAAWPKALPRPSRLLQPPESIEVTALLPDHPPAAFLWRRLAHRVRRADGPERVFGEWWRSPGEVSKSRDYFQLEDQTGQRFWVFRDSPPDQAGRFKWYLHGLFG